MYKTFKSSFNNEKKEFQLLFLILLPIISVIISLIVTFVAEDVFIILEKLISLLITYFSISIGFSLATIVFIIDQLRRFENVNEKETVEQILSLIVVYITHGIFMVIIFILEIIFGNIFAFNGLVYILINVPLLSFYFYMTISNLYIFYNIIKVLYYFSSTIINENGKDDNS